MRIELMALPKFFHAAESDQALSFEVHLTITDHDNRLLPNVAGRIVLGVESGWENSSSGLRFETEANGKTVFKIQRDSGRESGGGRLISSVACWRLKKLPMIFKLPWS